IPPMFRRHQQCLFRVQVVSYHKSMNEIDWNEKVKEALDRTEFMAISAIDAGGSWTCPVQFGHSLVIAKDSTCTFDRCLIRGTCDIYSRITASPLPFSKLTVFPEAVKLWVCSSRGGRPA